MPMQTPQDLFVHEVSDIRNAEPITIQMVEQGHHGRFSTRHYPDRGRRPDRRYLYLLSGSVGETVTDLSQRLLAHHGGLRGLFRLDVAELARIRGLGNARDTVEAWCIDDNRARPTALSGAAHWGRCGS